MANLKEVKARISSVQSTQQITKAMKMVAAAKLRRAQDKIIQMRPYAKKLNEILGNLSSGNSENLESPYFENREVDKVLLIVVTSDKGLCGAFNSNVFRATTKLISEKYELLHKKGLLEVLPIGKRSLEYFKKRDYKIVQGYHDLFQRLTFENVKEAAEYVMTQFRKEEYDRVDLVYNEFKNVATQILRKEQFLPIEAKERDTESSFDVDYIFEPSQEEIVSELIPNSLRVKLFKALLESNAAEHGARMTAMDQATDNANELLKDLRLTYNRTRQAAITTEILEIVAGAEALSGD